MDKERYRDQTPTLRILSLVYLLECEDNIENIICVKKNKGKNQPFLLTNPVISHLDITTQNPSIRKKFN